MNRQELCNALSMSYDELVAHLLSKYGPSTSDYFATPKCRSRRSAVSRTGEGLICHHIDEDKGGNLSHTDSAVLQPFEWQRKERLVYCNHLEHLLLHIKIAILRQKSALRSPTDVMDFFSTGGIYMVCHDVNALYCDIDSALPWQKNCFSMIESNYDDYISVLSLLLYYIDQQYAGARNGPPLLQAGSVYHYSDCDATVLGYDDSTKILSLRSPDGRERKMTVYSCYNQLTYQDALRLIADTLSSGHNTLYPQIRSNIAAIDSSFAKSHYSKLLVDFHGYGFPEFSHIPLDAAAYGSASVDEYISNAFPSFFTDRSIVSDREPVFWKGNIPRIVTAQKYPYVVRIRAVFRIKPGHAPFVPYKQPNGIMRTDSNFSNKQHHFLTFREGRPVSSTFVYDRRTNSYYARYYGLDNTIQDSDLIVSVTNVDYALMKKNYQILKCEVLDGCYFKPTETKKA